MKYPKLFCSGILFLSWITIAQAQEFAPTGARWWYSQVDHTNPFFESYSTIESVQDTLIANQNCHKMRITFHRALNDDQQTVFMYGTDHKIFYYSTDSLRFLQLCDFNKLVGDSFNIEGYYSSALQGQPLQAYIDSVDSVNINSILLKRIFTHSNDGLGLDFNGWSTENIGNDSWLFPFGDNSETGPLRCYQDTFFGLYEKGVAQSCDYVASVNEVNNKDCLSLFPNPATNVLTLKFCSSNNPNAYSLTIKSIVGKVMSCRYSSSQNELDVKNIAQGIYFLTVSSGDLILTKMFVKQ